MSEKRFLRLQDLQRKYGWGKSTIYAKEKAGEIPKRLHTGGRTVVWLESEIDDDMDKKVASSRANGLPDLGPKNRRARFSATKEAEVQDVAP